MDNPKTHGSGTEAMAFYWHFQPYSDDLPDSIGLLSAPISPVAINEAVRSAMH